MKNSPKTLFHSLTLCAMILLSTGCAPKNANGGYTSPYSYHPYQQNHISNTLATSIERTAKSLLGTDYQYGANGPYQYDCSGFTKHVFAMQGIHLPRVSRDQAMEGEYVNAFQLQKGDLLFFDSKKSRRISHVGIYLGEGKFIHASSSKDCVVISSLNSKYYKKHFKWGRRVNNTNYVMR